MKTTKKHRIFTKLIVPILAITTLGATPGEDFTRGLVRNQVENRAALRSDQPGKNPGPALQASAFGLSPSSTADGNAEALEKIATALTEKSASALVLEKGDYVIQLRSGKAAFAMRSLKDFTLKGNGARFLFRDFPAKGGSLPAFIVMSNCERVLLKDFSFGVDWAVKPLSVVGKVVATGGGKVVFEIGAAVKLMPEWEIRGGFEWDGERSSRSSVGYAFGSKAPGKILGDNRIEFDRLPGTPTVGQYSLLGVEYHARAVGFRMDGMNDHLTLDHVGIRGTPTTAMNGFTRHLWVHHSILAPPEGGHKACEDGFMINAEDYVFEHNTVAYSHDDVMNFTAGRRGGFLGGGLLPEGANSLIADHLQFYASKEDVEAGAEFFLADKNFAPTGWKGKLTAFEWQMNFYPPPDRAPHRCRMVFDRPVPELPQGQAKEFLLMRDYGNEGAYLIQNNTFSNCLRHGVWAGNGPGLIQENSFYQTGYPAIGVMMIVRWGRWYKGFYPQGVIIRGNTLEACNTALRRPADIYLATGWDNHQGWDTSPFPAVSHIIVETNTIRNSAQAALAVLGASNVSLLGNTIVDPGRVALAANPVAKEAIVIRNVHTGRMLGNVLTEKEDASVKGIAIEGAVDWQNK